MAENTTSSHVGRASELTLIAPLRRELVDVPHVTLSHATRLKLLFGVLFGSAKSYAEKFERLEPFPNVLEKLEVLQFVRYGLIENETKLLLAVAFDGGWETYLRNQIVGQAGPLLDAIFCHCEGYEGHSSDRGYPAFGEWVRAHQLGVEYLFAGFPHRSVTDARYLEEFERIHRDVERARDREDQLARHRVVPRPYPKLNHTEKEQRAEDLLNLLDALRDLEALFPPARDERNFLKRASALLTSELVTGLYPDGIPDELKRRHAALLGWFLDGLTQLQRTRPREIPLGAFPQADEAYEREAQGGILTGYRSARAGALLFLRLRDRVAASRFLADFAPTSDADARGAELPRNLAFTHRGIERVGLPERDLARLPQDFADGMQERAGLLGDVGVNHPKQWKELPRNWPPGGGAPAESVPLSAVDVVVQLRCAWPDEAGDPFASGTPLCAEIESIAGHPGVELLSIQRMRALGPEGRDREHFGFADGISQPHADHERRQDRHWAPLGDFLLGHPNRKGDQAAIPEGFENGSFLVVRKLRQDPSALSNFEKQHRRLVPKGSPGIVERLMGRWRDGRPLQDGVDLNDFDYAEDADGARTPVFAHVRRANPRLPETKVRILRRGMPYGPEGEGGEVGLVFMAYNASIAQQFEVVQGWLAGNHPNGGYGGVRDPFLGVPRPGESRKLRLRIDGCTETIELPKDPFVTLEWGLYLFAPSLPGLRRLAERMRTTPEPAPARRPAGLPDDPRVQRMARPGASASQAATLDEWRALLEDPKRRDDADAFWREVREADGVLRTAFGVLVGAPELVAEVLRDESRFSVRRYWDRMKRSLGALHLGMDRAPRPAEAPRRLDERYERAVPAGRYDREAEPVNGWLAGFDERDAFRASHDALPSLRATGRVRTRELAFGLVAALSRKWFGIPDEVHVVTNTASLVPEDAPANCPADLNAVARYVFGPRPTPATRRQGRLRGRTLRRAARRFLGSAAPEGQPPFVRILLARFAEDPDLATRALVGAVHGFVAPTGANLLSVLNEWAGNGELWRLQLELAAHPTWPAQDWEARRQRADDVLRAPLVATLRRDPVPDLLHRTALRETRLGGVAVRPGDRVVVSLRSAAAAAGPGDAVLFGGLAPEGEDPPLHVCKGRAMALGTLLGALCGLLEGHRIEVDRPGVWEIEPRAASD